jgi:hypothetical protein
MTPAAGSVSALPLLRAGNNTLRVQEPGRWLRGVAVGLAHPPRQISAGLSPDTVCPKPVIPSADRLVRTEVARQRSPLAARMLQVKTGIHHLAHIGSEGKLAPEERFDDIPFRVRQVTRIASPIILVFLTIFVCPHFNLLLTELNSPPGESVKQALKLRQYFALTYVAIRLRLLAMLGAYAPRCLAGLCHFMILYPPMGHRGASMLRVVFSL